MRLSKNVKGKKYIYFFIIISLFFSFLLALIITWQYQVSNSIINQKIASLIGEIKVNYPDVNEEKIIEILGNTSNLDDGFELLERLNINDNELAIKSLQELQIKNLYLYIGIVLFSYIVLITVFVFYLKHRQKSIDRLDTYIQTVSKGDYSMNIEDYSEDELSALKDSLYKVSVMLKEDSENRKRQNEAILDSVSDISHQLKTPLTSIQILLDNVIDNPNMDELTRNKFLSEISRQIKGMNFLILALLKLSRLDVGVVEFGLQEINLKDLINNVLSDLDVLIDVKQIVVDLDLSSDTKILGDYNWNKEAILNIVKNAIEHSPDGGTISIKSEDTQVYTSIKIADYGDGIDDKDLKHIFDKFYKVGSSNENSFGIGLALSKSILERQNAYIHVDSQLSYGTTFTIKYLK